MTATSDGVVWDLTSYFPEFDGPVMRSFKEALQKDIAQIQQQALNLGSLEEKTADQWEAIILFAEGIESRGDTAVAPLGCSRLHRGLVHPLRQDPVHSRPTGAWLGCHSSRTDHRLAGHLSLEG